MQVLDVMTSRAEYHGLLWLILILVNDVTKQVEEDSRLAFFSAV